MKSDLERRAPPEAAVRPWQLDHEIALADLTGPLPRRRHEQFGQLAAVQAQRQVLSLDAPCRVRGPEVVRGYGRPEPPLLFGTTCGGSKNRPRIRDGHYQCRDHQDHKHIDNTILGQLSITRIIPFQEYLRIDYRAAVGWTHYGNGRS
jgi:hypothetical protein